MQTATDVIKLPFYAKSALTFISLFAFFYAMSIAQDIVIPIIYATILAILLNPLVNFLMRIGTNKLIAIAITVLLSTVFVGFAFYLVFSQIASFSDSFPAIKEKFITGNEDLVQWFSGQTNINETQINDYLSKAKRSEIKNFSVGDNFIKIGHVVMTAVLLPVYMVMLLYYKPLLLVFIKSLFKYANHVAVDEVLAKTKKIIQTYVVGLFIETIIVAIMNSIGLLIIGIEYAILLGCLGAILNIIPYVGAIIAATVFMLIALLTMSPIYMLYVLILYLFVQFIDNNFLLPKIVAARVRINALVSIIVVIIGGTIWGIPGMFLAIPLIAIVKVICDHVDSLKPWGFLLGDIVPTASKFSILNAKRTSKT